MGIILTILSSKNFTDEQIYFLIYVLLGVLLLCVMLVGILALIRMVKRRKEKFSLLTRTKENLEKLEQILSSQAPFDIQSLYLITVSPSIRSSFLDLLRGFEYFSSLRGYHSLLSFHSLPNNQIGVKFSVGESGVSVNAGQAKTDFDDYLNRMEEGRDFEIKAIFLSQGKRDLSRNQLKKRLGLFQITYLATKDQREELRRLLDEIPERSFTPARTVLPQTPHGQAVAPEPQELSGFPKERTTGPTSQDTNEPGVHIETSFSARYEQIQDLESFIPLLAQKPETLHAAVWLEHVRNMLVEEDDPDLYKIREGFVRASAIIMQTEINDETTERAKHIYASFHLTNLLSCFPLNFPDASAPLPTDPKPY